MTNRKAGRGEAMPTASQELIEFLKREEGFRSIAYQPLPGDRWTVGYGFTFVKGAPVTKGQKITKQEADAEIERLVTKLSQQMKGLDSLSQQQFDALVSLAFNVGLDALMKSKTWALARQGKDISNRFILWNKFKGSENKGLTFRRLREKKIYLEGVYT